MAGGYGRVSNTGYYLYTGNIYWAMSPNDFWDDATARGVGSNGDTWFISQINDSYGVRPVINLKPNSLKSGDGSASNPYRII